MSQLPVPAGGDWMVAVIVPGRAGLLDAGNAVMCECQRNILCNAVLSSGSLAGLQSAAGLIEGSGCGLISAAVLSLELAICGSRDDLFALHLTDGVPRHVVRGW